MIADSVASRPRGQARGLRRRALLRRLPRRPRLRAALLEAAAGAAEWVTLCDTNGACLPSEVALTTRAVIDRLGDAVPVGIHTHDDADAWPTRSSPEQGARWCRPA